MVVQDHRLVVSVGILTSKHLAREPGTRTFFNHLTAGSSTGPSRGDNGSPTRTNVQGVSTSAGVTAVIPGYYRKVLNVESQEMGQAVDFHRRDELSIMAVLSHYRLWT